MGKTQVALEYTYRYRDCYDFIFWVQAETDPEMVKDTITISEKLKLEQPENAGDGAIIDNVRTWFENTGRTVHYLLFESYFVSHPFRQKMVAHFR